ncbi:hypothetical protein TSOC_005812 [Tetrabaena socialis]|uniref:Uncharacterized protein n=1 Tax=Tetrabaena socialis TaxID=47790 RepID=A0A2J8A583_9CHLO|nr:hypothetical protein TSOC_005812 [Tetrabaena socialis]|eukprot:PNH07678.1 hypothetical protein TSOC_005812 [Tetrabaena socialis]
MDSIGFLSRERVVSTEAGPEVLSPVRWHRGLLTRGLAGIAAGKTPERPLTVATVPTLPRNPSARGYYSVPR